MSDQQNYSVVSIAGPGFGVFWYIWGKVGFWHGVLYGIGWAPWVGYHLAHYLKP
jgi:hypothetical protein